MRTSRASIKNVPTKRICLGFTLVELVVVITILIILGTIAFVSLGGFSESARDGVRTTNASALMKGLDVSYIRTGSYPLPDTSSINILSGSTLIGYQGYVGSGIILRSKVSGDLSDPVDKTPFVYSVNVSQKKAQLLGFFESSTSIALRTPSPITEQVTAATPDYSRRYPFVKGQSLGIILSNTGSTKNQPIQDVLTGSVDVGSGTVNAILSAYISSWVLVGTWVSGVIPAYVGSGGTGTQLSPTWSLSWSSWIYKDANGNAVYPTSCNQLLTNSGTFFIAGSITASGSNAYKDGSYVLSPSGTPMNAYCDMSTSSGGWTLIASQSVYGMGQHLSWMVTGSTVLPSDPTQIYPSFYKWWVGWDTQMLFRCTRLDASKPWVTTARIGILFNNNAVDEYFVSTVLTTSANWSSNASPAFNTTGAQLCTRKKYMYWADGPQTTVLATYTGDSGNGVCATTASMIGWNARPLWTTEYVGCDNYTAYTVSGADNTVPKFWIYVR